MVIKLNGKWGEQGDELRGKTYEKGTRLLRYSLLAKECSFLMGRGGQLQDRGRFRWALKERQAVESDHRAPANFLS